MTAEEFYDKTPMIALDDFSKRKSQRFTATDMFDFAEAYADHCEESAWVSVDDSLPVSDVYKYGHSDEFLVVIDGANYLARFDYNHKTWSVYTEDELGDVTHWRPLPKNPDK